MANLHAIRATGTTKNAERLACRAQCFLRVVPVDGPTARLGSGGASAFQCRLCGTSFPVRTFEQYEMFAPIASAICTLANAFPAYRELFLLRKAKRLVALAPFN